MPAVRGLGRMDRAGHGWSGSLLSCEMWKVQMTPGELEDLAGFVFALHNLEMRHGWHLRRDTRITNEDGTVVVQYTEGHISEVVPA